MQENNEQWVFEYGQVKLPERREMTPIGRITLLGKELSLEDSRNYVKYLQSTARETK